MKDARISRATRLVAVSYHSGMQKRSLASTMSREELIDSAADAHFFICVERTKTAPDEGLIRVLRLAHNAAMEELALEQLRR